jgi:hypothetical protein
MEGRPCVDLKPCTEVPKKYKGQYTLPVADLTQLGVIWGETLSDGKRMLDMETFQVCEGMEEQTTRRRHRRANDNLSSSDEEHSHDDEAEEDDEGKEEEEEAPVGSSAIRVPATHESGRRRSGESREGRDVSNIESSTHVLCLTPTSQPHYRQTPHGRVTVGYRSRQKRCIMKCEVSEVRKTHEGSSCTTRCRHCIKPIRSRECYDRHRDEGKCNNWGCYEF